MQKILQQTVETLDTRDPPYSRANAAKVRGSSNAGESMKGCFEEPEQQRLVDGSKAAMR